MRTLLALLALLFVTPAHAQAPSPAQIGVTATTPQSLFWLDSTKTWQPFAIAGSYVPSNPALKGDAQFNKTATVTSVNGSSTFTITGSTFTSADVGKLITISNIQSGGTYLSSTITAVSGSSITLADAANANFGPAPAAVVWGTDDAAGVQAMLNQVSTAKAGMTRVQFGAGKYLVSVVSLIKSNTEVACDPGAEFYMLKAQSGGQANHWIFANENFAASTLTDVNISIHGCKFFGGTGSGQASGGTDGIRMRKATRIHVYNNRFEGLGDATAYLGTNVAWTHDNAAFDMASVCWDQWEGFQHHKISGNYCETRKFGMQATGTDTGQVTPLISSDLIEVGNTIVEMSSSSVGAGIWLNSGMTSGTGSGVQHVSIIGDVITTSGLGTSVADCVKISGDATSDVRVVGVHCDNGFLYAGPQDAYAGPYPTDIHFSSNHVNITNTLTGGAIKLLCQYCSADNNRIDGGGYQYAIDMDFKPNQTATNNMVVSGTDATSPRIHNGSGAGTNIIVDLNDTAATTIFATPVVFSASAASPISINGAAHNVQVIGLGTSGRSIDLIGYNAIGTNTTNINCAISRSTALGTFAPSQLNDDCAFTVFGDDGGAFARLGKVSLAVNGTVSAGKAPGRIDLSVADVNGALVRTLSLSATGPTAIMPTSAGAGGLAVCIDSAGVLYKKVSCP